MKSHFRQTPEYLDDDDSIYCCPNCDKTWKDKPEFITCPHCEEHDEEVLLSEITAEEQELMRLENGESDVDIQMG